MEIADFVIHVKAEIPAAEREMLADELADQAGVVSAHFSREHAHLLNIAYDPDVTSSAALLERVGARGGEAYKVGL